MSVRVIQERLESYGCNSSLEEEQALREITQEVILAGLSRSDFFSRAGFHGGTCLRVFHGLNRFSEDLDFALIGPDADFELHSYLEQISRELNAFGYNFEISDRGGSETAARKAFLKDDSIGKLLTLNYRIKTGPLQKMRIKLEVDTNPPEGALYEMPVLDYPFPAAIRVFDSKSLFAGKIHALLCRTYLKGRDWYDFVWYTARMTGVNHQLLTAAIDQQGPWQGQRICTDNNWCKENLCAVIKGVDWNQARLDVKRFVKQYELPSLELWSTDFFLRQCEKIG